MGISQKRCLFRDVSETSQKHLSQVFLVFQKYVTKMISCNFRRLITISDKIDVGPSETLKKWNVLWEQWIDINQLNPPNGLISTWEFWQVKDRQNPIVMHYLLLSVIFFSTDKTIYNLLSLWIVLIPCWNTEILAKLQKSCVIRFAIDIWPLFLITMLLFS